MILVCGIPSEPPIALLCEQLANLGYDYVLYNQRRFAEAVLDFEIHHGEVTGRLEYDGHRYRLEDFSGVYTRLVDDQILPELKEESMDSPKRRYSRALNEALIRWYEIAPCRVVNRTAPMGSNYSKPYQAQLIMQQGFKVPETLITNDPTLVRDFLRRHSSIIYKSISSVRSIVQPLDEKSLERLELIRWCPVQFQEFIEGTNIRVHTIGREVFATKIATPVIDYRYAHRVEDESANLSPYRLSGELQERCITLSKALELDFAGIDLKITPDNQVYCFEVNPSPAYSYYESQTGQPISKALAEYLSASN